MTRLPDIACDLLHQGARQRDQALQRMMPMDNFKQPQRELVTLVGARARDVTPLFETHEHAEHFIDRTSEAACDLPMAQSLRYGSKQLQDVQAFFKGWRCIAGSSGARLPCCGRTEGRHGRIMIA